MLTDLSVKARATVVKPRDFNDDIGASSHVQGTKKTLPIDTLTARRLSGSHDVGVSKTASTPMAAAERKMAPMLVVSVTPSMTATRLAPWHTSSTVGAGRRRMAHKTPRVSV